MEKLIQIAWSTFKPPKGATQDDDNHAGRDPMNLSPNACNCLSTRKNNRNPNLVSLLHAVAQHRKMGLKALRKCTVLANYYY